MSFLVVKDGQQLGPFTLEEVNAQLAGGMLDPSDLGWTEGFEEWYPLEQIEGFVMPGEPGAPPTETVVATATVASGSEPAIKTVAEAAASSSPGRRKWIWGGSIAAGLMLCFGAYQFVYAAGSQDNLCSVLVEIIIPPKPFKKGAEQEEVTPSYAKQYINAGKAAEGNKTPIDAVNEFLDLRGDFHFTRGVKGLSDEAGEWLKQFTRDSAPTPEGQGIIDVVQAALQSGGLNDIDALGMSSVTMPTNLFRHTAMVHRDHNSTARLWRVMDNNQSALDGLRHMPPDTVLAIHGRVRLADLSQWVGELNDGLQDSKLLADAWEALKGEVPVEQLQNSWTGEVGLYLTLSTNTFAADNPDQTELKTPGLLLVLGVKDGELAKMLGKQLDGWKLASFSPALMQRQFVPQVVINKIQVSQQIYQNPSLPDELKSLELIPTICQSGNYLVLSIGATPASSVLKRASLIPAGMIAAPGHWISLTRQSADNVSVPKVNLAFYLAPQFGKELAQWQKLSCWADIDPALRKILGSLAGSKQDGGLLATIQVLPEGVLFKGHVRGTDSGQSFQRVKRATRVFAAELVPQLVKLAHQEWSKLELPAKPEPKPEPPTNPDSNGN